MKKSARQGFAWVAFCFAQIFFFQLLKYQNELLPDIIEFNDALKWAFRNLWDMAEKNHDEWPEIE